MKYTIHKFYPSFVNISGLLFGLQIEFKITNFFNPHWHLVNSEGILVKEFENFNELKNYCRDYELEIII